MFPPGLGFFWGREKLCFLLAFFFPQQLFPSGEISNPWLEHKAVSAGLGSLKTPPWLAPCEAVTALTSQELQGGTGMLLKSAPFRRELGNVAAKGQLQIVSPLEGTVSSSRPGWDNIPVLPGTRVLVPGWMKGPSSGISGVCVPGDSPR